MRIRKNQWLTYVLAASIPVLTATSGTAQNTTATAASDATATGSVQAASVFKLEPGDQLIYNTKGDVTMEGMGQDQTESLDLTTSLTVLQKQGNVLTMFASFTNATETTAGIVTEPGPRFTFELPDSGVIEGEELEKAGLAGPVFPTFSVEGLFIAPGKDGSTSETVALPITDIPAQGETVVTTEGGKTKTVLNVIHDNNPVMNRTSILADGKTESIETSVSMNLTARNMPISLSIQDKTELVSSTKLPADQLANLKSDIESAVPIALKLQTLSMSSGDTMKEILGEVTAYLEKHPAGEFAMIFESLHERLESVVQRTANWDKIKKGETPPDFTATTIDNKTVKLSDLKGKVVLLDFWATWCGPCLAELPHIKSLYEANKDKGFEIIGISADETVEDLQQLVEQENLQWPQIFDGDDKPDSIQKAYGVMKYPTTILLDKEGKISEVDLRGEDLDKAIEGLL